MPVAEFTASQILLANKGFFQCMSRTKSARSSAHLTAQRYPGNFETLVGLLGAGMIGSRVIQNLRETQLKIKVFDPFLSQERAESLGVERWSLDEIFARCQTISNHLPNNAQTRHMLAACDKLLHEVTLSMLATMA